MKLPLKTMLLAATAALVSAPASATWYGYGTFEPNTPYDTKEWMFQDPPVSGQRVYFNVITASQYSTVNGKPSVNPNVGILHSQVEPAGVERHYAQLGVWLDCNGDGYIGMAETGVREYSATLLLSEEVCPPITGPVTRWTAGAHNYNGWVSELIPLSRGDSNLTDARTYRDDDIRMWGDFHRPDEKPFHRSCALFPQPRGTYHNTGGLMNYFDCRVDIIGIMNDGFAQIGDPLGFTFADEDDARTGPLGRIILGGDEDDANAAVRTRDCAANPAVYVHSGDTFNQTPLGPSVPGTLQNRTASVPSFQPSAGDLSSPTLAGQVNRTMEEIGGDCDTSNDFGHDLYAGTCWIATPCVGETDFNGVNPNNKTEADWNFGFVTGTRGTAPFSAMGPLGLSGPAGAPSDGGVGFNGGSFWLSDSIWVSKTGPRSLRVDLDAGGVQIAPAYWLSFYVKLGENTTNRAFSLPGGEGKYGSWHCGSNTSGIHNGWNCDPAVWYINPDGTFPNNKANLAHVGWDYHLRDVDCYDGRIGELGIGIQPAYYGPEACA